MSDYVFLQSQDPFTETQTLAQYQLIHNLATKDNRVTLYLIQNGVMPARRGALCKPFDLLCNQNINVVADRFSLEQRGIELDQLKSGVNAEEIGVVIDAMLRGDKVIWN